MACLAVLTLLAGAGAAWAQGFDELLAKGPLVQLETDSDGRFAKATAIAAIDRPVEEVWATVTDFAHQKDFLPKVLESTVSEPKEKVPAPAGLRVVDVKFEVEAPGSNPKYTFRYEISDAQREIDGRWLAGDLKGSKCHWKAVATGPSRTLLFYSTATKNFSAFAESFEDDQQSLTVAANVSAALTVVKGVKAKVEAPKADAGSP